MVKKITKTHGPNKKHLARQEKEARQKKLIITISIIVVLAVVALIGFGVLQQTVLADLKPVATVNGEKITTKQFQNWVRYYRYTTIRQAQQTMQFAQVFGNDPTMLSSIGKQLQSLTQQMSSPIVGDAVLNQMIDDILIKQEAEKLGITVTEEEVNKALHAAFGYFPEGTPTATPTYALTPTPTLSELQETLLPPTTTPMALIETPEVTSTITNTKETTPTLTPTATLTPTPYTQEQFEKNYEDIVTSFEDDFNIPENTIYEIIESQLYHEKVKEAIVSDVECTEEQVWALHILVDDEDLANQIYDELQNGGDWASLAAQYSQDTSNKDKSGDLGWFGRSVMTPDFEEAAFSLEVGETSQPVKTEFGWHIIRVLGHENKQLSAEKCDQLKEKKFNEWLQGIRDEADIQKNEDWLEVVPPDPTMPPDIMQFIRQIMAIQPTPQPAP
jgi:parvulin-like peptidyl-prolyl isomerase